MWNIALLLVLLSGCMLSPPQHPLELKIEPDVYQWSAHCPSWFEEEQGKLVIRGKC